MEIFETNDTSFLNPAAKIKSIQTFAILCCKFAIFMAGWQANAFSHNSCHSIFNPLKEKKP